MDKQQIDNAIEMIGCSRKLFLELIDGKEKISMSSGSYYAEFLIFSGIHLIARFASNGVLIGAYSIPYHGEYSIR